MHNGGGERASERKRAQEFFGGKKERALHIKFVVNQRFAGCASKRGIVVRTLPFSDEFLLLRELSTSLSTESVYMWGKVRRPFFFSSERAFPRMLLPYS